MSSREVDPLTVPDADPIAICDWLGRKRSDKTVNVPAADAIAWIAIPTQMCWAASRLYASSAMIRFRPGMKVWLETDHIGMRKGFPDLSFMVLEALKRDPMCGHPFVFRGRRGGLIKVI
jgi:hypothetical protein